MNNIAIVVVAYNRVHSLERLLRSLENADYSRPVTLIISVDKSGTDIVEQYADNYIWNYGEKRVIRHSENLGLRKHILSLGQYFLDFDALVVLEDDVTVVPSFMHYVDACYNKYKDEDRIAGISLYSYSVNYHNEQPFVPVRSDSDVYLMQVAQSWGQIWLKKQWTEFKDWYDMNDKEFDSPYLPASICNWPKSSWLKYHMRYCIEKDKYFVYPYLALSTNNGDAGVNFEHLDTLYQSVLQVFPKKEFTLPDFSEISVKYDAYFEAMFLGSYVGIDDDYLTIDINSLKSSVLRKQFLLSTTPLPYKVVKSYAMELRPIEANVMFGRTGNDIWLYDTSKEIGQLPEYDCYNKFYYQYGKAFNKLLFMVGIKRTAALLYGLLGYKANKILHGKK